MNNENIKPEDKRVKAKIGKNDLEFTRFDPSKMVNNPSMCMIAKRRSGKSWLIRDLLFRLKDIPAGIIICPTERMNRFYGEFFPETFIYHKFDENTVEKLLARQINMIDKAAKKKKRGKKLDPRVILVMDDCLADSKSWKKNETVLETFYNGRHYQITYILTIQYSVSIPPNLRTNFDFVFLLKEEFISSKKRLHEHFVGMIGDFNDFREIFDKMTSNFGCMVVDLTCQSENPLDKINWYKARGPEQIQRAQIGCNQFNKFHRKNFDENWRRKNGLHANVADKLRKKNKSSLNAKLI
jgi:hypothetical protein